MGKGTPQADLAAQERAWLYFDQISPNLPKLCHMFSQVLNKPRAGEDMLGGLGGREQVSSTGNQATWDFGTGPVCCSQDPGRGDSSGHSLSTGCQCCRPVFLTPRRAGGKSTCTECRLYPGASCNSLQHRESCLHLPAISRQSLLLATPEIPAQVRHGFFVFTH